MPTAAQYDRLHAAANEAALHIAGTRPTVRPGAPTLAEQHAASRERMDAALYARAIGVRS